MLKKITCALLGALVIGLAAVAPAFAWGGEGHSYAAILAVRSLPPSPLKTFWTTHETWLAINSSYPDRWRNRPDAAENPRHFLDAEHFGFGMDVTKIPRSFSDVVKVRTYEQLRTDGMVPWTVSRHYKLLVLALRQKRWENAMIESAYLSHYIADSHVPFHASANYDGQLSEPSQKGIHSRFETQTLQRSIKLSDLKTGEPLSVSDPIALTFDTLQASISQVPAILAADKEAVGKSGGEYNDTYWTAFLPISRSIAIARLEMAGRALAGLLQAAWNEAKQPAMPTTLVNADRLLPYAPIFVARGETAPPTPEPVPAWIKDVDRERVKTIQVPSKALGKEATINILLPADYDTSKLRYPVLYLLHGASGAYSDWNKASAVAAYARERSLIIVMPDANGDSFYLNSPGKGKVADYFIKELIPFVDKQYRTLAAKEGRAIAGLSMGGYGAWRLALDNAGTFACAASLSGALGFGEGDPGGLRGFLTNLYGPTADQATYNKEALLPRIQSSITLDGHWAGPILYFDCGGDDFLLKDNRRMEEELLKRGVPYEYAEFKGQHEWIYWDEHIRDVLQFVERQISPAK